MKLPGLPKGRYGENQQPGHPHQRRRREPTRPLTFFGLPEVRLVEFGLDLAEQSSRRFTALVPIARSKLRTDKGGLNFFQITQYPRTPEAAI
jgi:hypothetical protein